MESFDRIHLGRIRSLKEWMRRMEYDGKPRAVLKGLEDMRSEIKKT